MSDKEKDYFVPEQLEDSDFEKEKQEAKNARKEKKFELNKKQMIKIVSIVLVIVLIGVGIYLYLNPIEKKATAPEKTAEDFAAYFNSGNWKKINNLIDLRGYYVLGYALDETNYTKFDVTYDKVESDQTYLQYEKNLEILSTIDEEILNSISGDKIKINKIEACNLIQGTETLYKLRVDYDYVYYDGQKETGTGVIYVSNASGDYKIVYGDWIEVVLNYYQSAYMLQSNYGY